MKAIADRVKLLFGPISIICLWFGTYVGPGFATGSLQTSFLLGTGWMGVFIGPLFVCILTAFIVYFVLEYARRFELNNYRSFYDRVYGKYSVLFANFKDFTMIVAAIVIASMVTALGGSLLSGILPIPQVVCSLITAIIVIVLVMFGRDVVRKSTAYITIAMILMLIILIIRGLGPSLPGAQKFTSSRVMNTSYPGAFWKFIVYSNFALTFTDAAYPQIKGVLNSKKDVLITVIVGFALNFLCTIGTTILISAGMPDTATSSVPIMWVIQNIIHGSKAIQIIFTFIAYFALLSTIVGWMYSFVDRADRVMGKAAPKVPSKIRHVTLLIVLMAIAMLLSKFGVLAIVSNGYSTLGMISVPVFYIPFLVILPLQMKRASRNFEEHLPDV